MSAEIKITQSQNGKLTQFTLHTATIWFSYETPVAYTLPGIAGVVTSDKGWTQTTRRHIASIEGRRAPIDHEVFERGLMAVMYAVSGMYTTNTVREITEAITAAETAAKDRIALISLDARAQALYERELGWQDFAAEFTRQELEQLAGLCQIQRDGSGGRGYDDEVFDALALTEA